MLAWAWLCWCRRSCRRASTRRQVLGAARGRRSEEVRGPLRGPRRSARERKSITKVGRESLLRECRAHRRQRSRESELSLTLVQGEIEIGRTRRNAHGNREKKNMQLSACGRTRIETMDANVAISASDGDCVAQNPPIRSISANVAQLAMRLYNRVTAQVPRTHVRRLQSSVARLQPRHGGFVSVQTPRLVSFEPDKS